MLYVSALLYESWPQSGGVPHHWTYGSRYKRKREHQRWYKCQQKRRDLGTLTPSVDDDLGRLLILCFSAKRTVSADGVIS